ncbi:hypothetical protein [Streptomyces sp. NPDC020681]|uniref:hypothetical protein n=1 Tax=Streptomyces sp. NPDC020681 TaxID=3365083 RepID=UPI0037BB1CD6
MQKTALKTWSARLAATTVIAATAALIPAGSAQAGTPHIFALCNTGRNYDVRVDIRSSNPRVQSVTQTGIKPGKCWSAHRPLGTSDHVVLTSSNGFGQRHVFGWFDYDPRQGVSVHTRNSNYLTVAFSKW